jgi:hypothetical protein
MINYALTLEKPGRTEAAQKINREIARQSTS